MKSTENPCNFDTKINMKTRTVYPQLWHDTNFCDLSIEAIALFGFLITNPYLGLSRYSRISDRQIQFHTGLSGDKLKKAKQQLEGIKWVFFKDEWQYHNHQCAHMEYSQNHRVEQAREKEISSVPADVKEWFEHCLNGVETVLQQGSNTVQTKSDDKSSKVVETQLEQGSNGVQTINNKQLTINNNKKDRGVGEEKNVDVASELLAFFNKTFGKNFRNAEVIKQNLDHWLTIYSIDQIKKAITIARTHEYWHDKITLEVLLRRKNPSKQDVDRIDEMLNYTPKKDFQAADSSKYDGI